jgi:hypothetical protein
VAVKVSATKAGAATVPTSSETVLIINIVFIQTESIYSKNQGEYILTKI